MKDNIKIVVLAAGHGKRMMSDLPKVLMPVKGKSMIKRLLESVEKSGIDDSPTIVVGYKKELVMEEFGKDKYYYAVQNEPLGTGHAVMTAKEYLEDKASHIMVLFGDNPFLSPETINKITRKHIASGAKITMATVELLDFEEWRAFFYTNFSRIVRDKDRNIIKSVEFRDANQDEKIIREVNPCYFCFEAKWLWENLKKLKNENAQKEYYLPDLIKIAIEEGVKIESIKIDPVEALAANSREELEILEKFAV